MSSENITLGDDGGSELPIVEVLTGRGFITGKSGAGKSNTASVVVEELLDRGFPLLIVDTDGEYWGLKEEFEILHAGADDDDECDLQVGPEHAGKLAELALEENVPIILDVSGFIDSDEADDLVRETAKELFHREKKLKKPFLLLVEEIHEYIPEGGGLDDTGEMLIRVAKRGRKRGLGLVGISQRPANVKKDFITQCDWLLWHRLTWESDTDVVRRVVGKGYDDDVQELEDGEAFLMADFVGEDIARVSVRRKRTFDAGATPDLEDFERPDLKSVSGDLVGELEEITEAEQERQDRVAELESKLEARDERIEALEAELEEARNMQEMAEQFTDAMTSAAGSGGDGAEAIQERVEEIREEKQAEIRELKDERDGLRERVSELSGEAQDLRSRVEELEEYEQAVENIGELEEAARRMTEALGISAANGNSEKYRKRLESRQERIDELEREVERLRQRDSGELLAEDAEYIDFVREDPVQEAINAAKEDASCAPKYVEDVIATIIGEGGWVDYKQVAEYAGVSGTSNISPAAAALARQGVVEKEEKGGSMKVDLNIGGIEDIIRKQKKREEMDGLKEDIFQ